MSPILRLISGFCLVLGLGAACSASPMALPLVPPGAPALPAVSVSNGSATDLQFAGSSVSSSMPRLAALLAGSPTAKSSAGGAPTLTRPAAAASTASTPTVTPTPRVLALKTPPLLSEDVRLVEKQLVKLGYAEAGEPDGLFDAQAQAAVQHFQWLNRLPVTGVVDAQTQAALFAKLAVPYVLPRAFPGRDLSRKSKTNLCEDHALQERLAELGYLDTKLAEWASGEFGAGTEAAVKKFQAANKLKADGVVNLTAWEKLFSPSVVVSGTSTSALSGTPGWKTTIFPVGSRPGQLAFDGTRLWVNGRDAASGTEYVLTIDPANGRASAPIRLGDCPESPSVSAHAANLLFAKRLWVMLSDPARLQAVSATGIAGKPVELSKACQPGAVCMGSSALGFDGTRLWAGAGDDTLVGLDPLNGQTLSTRTADWLISGDMVFDGQCLWYATDSGSVQRFGPAGADCQGYVGVDAVAMAFDGERLWVSTGTEVGSLAALAPTLDVEALDFYPAGRNPSALAYDSVRKWMWVANAGDNTVQAIDVATGAVSAALPVGRNPSALLFDGKRLWVANQDSGTVQYLDPASVKMPVATPRPTRTPAPTRTPMPTPTAPVLTRALSLKTPALTGTDVKQLQTRLLELSYTEVGTPDGSFGKITDAAVRHFQEVNGLVVDGVVGPKTWALLYSGQAIGLTKTATPASGTPAAMPGVGPQRMLSLQTPPLTGADVRQLQARLRELNYLGCRAPATVVDGSFGKMTDAAVKRFQANNGLEANGQVGPETWVKLLAASAAPAGLGPVTLPASIKLPAGTAGMIAVVNNSYEGGQIYVLDADLGSLPRQLTSTGNNYDPAWSPDGGRIAYTSDLSGNFEIHVASATGAGAVQITCGSTVKTAPAWSPDGTRLVFSAAGDTPYSSNLYVINADGTGLVQLPVPAKSSTPAWGPSGQIAFVSKSDGDADIYLINPDGSGLVALTSNSWEDLDPDWSPDGGRLLFSSNRGGTSQLYTMNADGSDQRALMNLNLAQFGERVTIRYPSWSPGGDRIAFQISGAGAMVGLVRADGTGLIWFRIDLLLQPDWMP
jgi:YVTN family beta-propeller protein